MKTTDKQKINVMLVDDHAMLREGLRMQINRTEMIVVVAEAGSIAEMMNQISFRNPSIIILDVNLPDGNGISQIPDIKQRYPELGIIILTMYDHARYAEHAMQNQADGYVLKGEPFEELLQAIQAVSQKKTYISSQMAPAVERVRTKPDTYQLGTLSKREFEALSFLSQGLSIKAIAEKMGISEKSVSTYRTRLMKKLDLKTNADLVRLAMETGISV